jgi:hypothetical protein
MRGHPKRRDDADDDCSNDEFDQSVAAQLARASWVPNALATCASRGVNEAY